MPPSRPWPESPKPPKGAIGRDRPIGVDPDDPGADAFHQPVRTREIPCEQPGRKAVTGSLAIASASSSGLEGGD